MKSVTINGARVAPLALLLGVFASIGGFIFGYDIGQISIFLTLPDFLKRFAECTVPGDASTCEFSNVREGLIVAMLSAGTLVGSLAGAMFADWFGRRKAMSIDCLFVVVGTVIQTASITSWEQFMVGRIITGVGVGALSAAVPLYQAETAPKEIRGSLTATYQLFITFGILLAYCFTVASRALEGTSAASGGWRIPLMLNVLWCAILAIGILFAPESPRWLVAKGRSAEAERNLARIRGVTVEQKDVGVCAALNEIEESIAEERAENYGWIACFKPERKTLYRTLLVVALQMFQQLTGANYFFYYGASILQGIGLRDSAVAQIIFGAVDFVCTFGGMYFLERFGRRRPLIIGGLWQAAWLFVFASLGTAKDPNTDKPVGKFMIASACLFIMSYAFSWAPGVWILTGESFATRSRAKQASLAAAGNWSFNLWIAFATPYFTSAIGFKLGYVWASCNLAGAVFVYFFLYESSKLSLEAVDMMYRDPNCKPWNSRKWCPPGYDSRTEYLAALRDEEKAQALKKATEHREFATPDSHSDDGTVVGERAPTNNEKAALKV